MAESRPWMIYGATGYTGELVAREARAARSGADPGRPRRRALPHSPQSSDCLRACFRSPTLRPTRRALDGVAVVAHCAGPFAATFAPMIDACLAASALRRHHRRNRRVPRRRNEARRSEGGGYRRLPGRRFRCHPHRLRRRVPDRGVARRDAARARLQRIAGDAAQARREPRSKARGRALACAGTARSSPSRSASVLARSTSATVPAWQWRFRGATSRPRTSRRVSRISRSTCPCRTTPSRGCAGSRGCGRSCTHGHFARSRAASPPGAIRARRRSSATRKRRGCGAKRATIAATVRTARLVTSNGYRLTVDGVLMAVRALLVRAPGGGYFTPSQLLGARCVERLPGCSAITIV